MKKLLLAVILLVLFYGRYQYVDLSKFQSDVKHIEIKGEVVNPGVYEAHLHARISDLLKLAGGVNPEADLSSLNQAKDLGNGAVLVIPEQTIKEKISINTASAEQLEELKGVGPAMSKRIIDYRNAQPFRSREELKNVKGIGDKMYEKIKEQIAL